MGKAAIQAQIDANRVLLTNLSSKISKLEGCKKSLTDFSTKIEYVLKNHDHIKMTYNLAGTPYLNETNNEEKILKTAETNLSGKKDDIIAKLTQKIIELEAEKSGVIAEITGLEFKKFYIKEE